MTLANDSSAASQRGGFLLLATLLPVAWVAAIALAGGYERRFVSVGPEEFRRLAIGVLGLIAIATTVSLATAAEVAQGFIVVALPTAAVLTWLGRYVMRKRVQAMRSRGRYLHRTLIVGDAPGAHSLIKRFQSSHHHVYHAVGVCLASSNGAVADSIPGPHFDIPVVGSLGTIAQAVADLDVDSVVVLASPDMDGLRLRRLSWELESAGATLTVAPALMEFADSRMAVRAVDGVPLLHLDQAKLSGIGRLFKSLYEPVVAAMALTVLAPVFAAISIAIKLDTPGPVFFRQARVGRLGQPFMIMKFRSMVSDADEHKHDIADLDVGSGPLFKVHSDPRVTRVGSLLRRTSLDELPQLFNVIMGQMSLVGPRPHLVAELALFGEDFSRRLLVKPGITGLWQVSGRSDLCIEETVKLDLRYVDNWSLNLDASIMLKTVRALAKQKGAY